MRLYIAGPMAGYPEHNKTAFFEAQRELESVGFETVNPAALATNMSSDDVVGSQAWIDCLKQDIPHMLQCDGLAMLEGWEMSRGARVEFNLGRELDMLVYSVHVWVVASLDQPYGK